MTDLRSTLAARVQTVLEVHRPVDTMLDDGEEMPYWKACSEGDCCADGYAAHAAELATKVFIDCTADPADETTWHMPCWNCGHIPGCEWDELHFARCSNCHAD